MKWGLCKQSGYSCGFGGQIFFSVCESRALTGNHSRGGCVYEGIHHNIVYLRASFSHTWITGIAHWQRHTLSLTNRRNTQSFPTSTPQKHTYTSGYTSAFPHCFHTPPRHTASYAPLSHTLSAHTNLAFCYSLSWSSSSSTRQADRIRCLVQRSVVWWWWWFFAERIGPV